MNKNNKKLINLFARYILILLAGLNSLYIFYKLLTLPTLYLSKIFLSIFTSAVIVDNFIAIPNHLIEIIPACVAGSAYYLLFILLMAIPEIKILKRIKTILFAFLVLLIINSLRIAFLALLPQNLFNATHLIFWYFVSTILAIAIYFTTIKLFKIKNIPVYDDVKFLLSIKKTKKSKRNK